MHFSTLTSCPLAFEPFRYSSRLFNSFQHLKLSLVCLYIQIQIAVQKLRFFLFRLLNFSPLLSLLLTCVIALSFQLFGDSVCMKNAVQSSPVCFAVLTEALAHCADYTVDWPGNTGH